jgi:hypothetical protein
LSTLWDIPTSSIGLERDETFFPMPLGKQIKLLKTATEKAPADQLKNAAGYAFLQEQSELAGLMGMPYTAE